MLTKGQKRIWDFIQSYVQTHACAPTISEITDGIGLKSRSAVHRAVQAISTEGLINIIPNKRRNILLQASNHEIGLPLVGRIAAGEPIEAIEQQEYIDINALFTGEDRYLLKVKGDSMIGDNICDGDYVVCEKAETARDGSIVVALIDRVEATLKRLFRQKDNSIILQPSNPQLKPMHYPAHRVQVQGLFVGLFRLG